MVILSYKLDLEIQRSSTIAALSKYYFCLLISQSENDCSLPSYFTLRDSGDNDHELLERFRYISSAIAPQRLAQQNPQPPTTFQQEDSFMRTDTNVKDGTDKDGSSGVVLPARQRRKRLCSYQVRMLQVHFEMNPFPTDEAKRTLAVSLQLTTKQVQNW